MHARLDPRPVYLPAETEDQSDLRSLPGDGGRCAPCPGRYSVKTSAWAPFPLEGLNSLLRERITFYLEPQHHDPPPPPTLVVQPGVSFETNQQRLIQQVLREVGDNPHAFRPSYHLVPDPHGAGEDMPMFLHALSLVLRLCALDVAIELCVNPEYMGVPGTSYGLRCQLREWLAQMGTTHFSVRDIVALYTQVLGDLAWIPAPI